MLYVKRSQPVFCGLEKFYLYLRSFSLNWFPKWKKKRNKNRRNDGHGTLPGNQLTGDRFSIYKHLYLWFGIEYNKITYHAVFLNVLATFWINFCKKFILFTILTRDWKKLGVIKNYLSWLPGKYFNHIFYILCIFYNQITYHAVFLNVLATLELIFVKK